MHLAKLLGTLGLTLAVPTIAAELEDRSATYRISYPDSWVVIDSGTKDLEVATRSDPYRGHGVWYVTTGAAVIRVAPTDREEWEKWARSLERKPIDRTPRITELRTAPQSAASGGRIEFRLDENETRQIALYRKVGGRAFSITLVFNDGDPAAAKFQDVQNAIAASIKVLDSTPP